MALRDLLVRIRGDKTQLDSTLKGAGGSVNSFSDSIKKLGAAIGVAFGVQQIVNFAKEASKLAATAEGIKKGFDQIATPGLLEELRQATKGTVTDMQLMSRAIQANNFQIPLKDLAKLLEFASARAIQTGQSVDYLVDSIVLGIGRKSPLILDNLGISAVRLRQLLKGVGTETASVGQIAAVVGQIATEELGKMGGMADTAAVKTQQIASSWAAVKTAIGEAINNSVAYQRALESIQGWLTKIKDIQGGATGRGKGVAEDEISFMKSEGATREEMVSRLMVLITQYGETIDGVKEDNKGLAVQLAKTWNPFKTGELKDQIKANKDEITELTAAIQVFKKALEDLSKAPPITTVLSNKPFVPGKIGGLSPSVGGRTFDSELTSITDYWVKGKLDSSGANELRKGPDESKIAAAMAIQDMIAAQEKLDAYMDEVENTLQAGKQMAIDLGADFIGALGEAVGGGNMKDIGKGLLLSFANFMSSFGKMLITLGIGMKAFQESLKDLFTNPLVPIIAGAALIATAGIIRGAAQRSANSVKSGSGGGGYSAGATAASIQNIKVQIEGTLKGKDIYWSNKRFVNELNTGS